MDDLVARAGGINVGAAVRGYGTFSKEQVLAHPPDVVLGDAAVQAAFRADPLLGRLPLYGQAAFMPCRGDLTSRPGPRLADGLVLVARALHAQDDPPRQSKLAAHANGDLLAKREGVAPPSAPPRFPAPRRLGRAGGLSPGESGPRCGTGRTGQTASDASSGTLRLPRILLAALVGASLAAAGVAFQALLRNELADPYLVGVSAGASVGAEAVLLGHGEAASAALRCRWRRSASAAGAMTVVYTLARRRAGPGDFTAAGRGRRQRFSGRRFHAAASVQPPQRRAVSPVPLERLAQDATLAQCGVTLGFLVVGLLILMLEARAMNLFALGEESAQQLGVETERFKIVLIVTGSLLTAATVAFAGIIGFVGLMSPHIARRLARTPDHRVVLPLAALCGAILMVWADTLARSIFPDGRELPVGIVTAFLGAPSFCYLLRRQQK